MVRRADVGPRWPWRFRPTPPRRSRRTRMCNRCTAEFQSPLCPLWVFHVIPAIPACPVRPGGFNRSAQHLLILRGEEVCHGDVADLVHGSAEGRAVGAMEEWAKCCGHLAGVGKEEQDWR